MSSVRPASMCQSVFLRRLLVALSTTVVSIGSPPIDAAAVDYLRDVKPVLKERCFACHGALEQESGLRVDTAELLRRGGDSGSALVAGDPAGSLLIERVADPDPASRMPPEGEPLTAGQIEALTQWVAQGALSPADEEPEADPSLHWAFRPIVRPEVPARSDQSWGRNPIDALIASRHESLGLTPQLPADAALQVRRLYIDLIGMPPTPDEAVAILGRSDNGPLDESDYTQLVHSLLEDPRHGERWARHWMDIWRYSDWFGLGDQLRNSQLHIWHWRDWIVESLNDDLPYDEMVRLMLAGDELAPQDLQKLRATGYLARNFFLFNRHQWMDETVEHVSKSFLGLTMNCAKCHDHKYDPLPQDDYYRMRAFFEPYHVRLDMLPGETDLKRNAIPRAFDGPADIPTYLFVRGEETQPDKSRAILPGVPDVLQFKELEISPVDLPAEAWQPERRQWVQDSHLAAAESAVEAANNAVAAASGAFAQNVKLHEDLIAKAAQAEIDEVGPGSARPDSPVSIVDEFTTLDPLRREPASAMLAEPTHPAQAERAVGIARAKLHLAQRSLAVAEAQRESLRQRVAALSLAWQLTDTTAADDDLVAREQAARISAIRAERQVAVASAERTLADAQLRRLQASEDQWETIDKEIETATQNVASAQMTTEADVGPDERYASISGAQWTPTRFLSSSADDPVVPFPPQSSGRRTALADWITDPGNPLTARVAVNHIWTRHMGTPLVPTVFDFGRQGTPPTHPELLDWLASELIDSGWSMKHIHRLILSSETYWMQSSAAGREANEAIDSENKYWWRRVPTRLESQAVRDSILALAGKLDLTRGGPSIPLAQQADSPRRSLYFFHSNNERNLFLTMFDEASVTECYRRQESIVPQQALALTNSRLVLDAILPIAERIGEAAGDRAAAGDRVADEDAFICLSFVTLVGFTPTDDEIAACREALATWRGQDGTTPSQARAYLVWTLLNHNDFVTLR